MKLRLRFFVLLLLGSTSFGLLSAEDEAWKLRRDREGIQVYTRSVAGSPFDAVRATAVVETVRLTSLVALIQDAEACPEWADRCAESYLIEQLSENESLIYTHSDMPFPVKDRDVVAHVSWSQDPVTFEVMMNSVAITGRIDEVRGRLRLTDARAIWRFTPLPSGEVAIFSEAHINPGSSLPGWVTNMLLVDTPFETMKSFVAEAVKPKYADAQLSFIQEPSR